MGLLDRRLLVVTGKGGTGKSTISAALALLAARRGKRVLVCEVTARERVSELYERPCSGTNICELQKNVFSVHVRPREAMREYALMTLRYELIYNAVFENKVVRYFLNAAPSLAEIVLLGKVYWHAVKDIERGRPRWDLVILDAPATGHGLTLLTVPEVFLSLVQDGPLARDMRDMQALLTDPERCATSIVSLPEEMPANEAVELSAALKAHQLPRGPLFLNMVFKNRFSQAERIAAARGGPQLAAAAEAADAHEARADLAGRYRKFLIEKVPDQPLVEIPHLFERHFGLAALDKAARAIEAAL